MNFPYLRVRDNLPAAGVLQMLLNRAGATLLVDGHFGPKTLAALKQYQEEHRISPTGEVDEPTWSSLAAGVPLPIVDTVDFWDPDLYVVPPDELQRLAQHWLPAAGVCRDAEEFAEAFRARMYTLFLLRAHGLGGTPHPPPGPSVHQRMLRVTAILRPIFGPYGCVHFVNSRMGRGADGRRVLWRLADDLDVPVTAALNDQLASVAESPRYIGCTGTVVPRKGSIASWSASRPGFAPPRSDAPPSCKPASVPATEAPELSADAV